MKTLLAAALVATAAAATATPAAAESTYWQERWRYSESTPEARYFNERDAARRAAHPDVRIHKRSRYADRRADRDRDYDGPAWRSYNGPAYQSQEQVQQSVYDFATGGSGAIDKFR